MFTLEHLFKSSYTDDMETSNPIYEIQNQEAYSLAKKNMPKEEDILLIAEFYKIMGDPTRLKILSALDQSELCVSDLALIVEISRSAISHQLKSLKTAKLVKSRKDGKTVYYSLDDDHIHSLIQVAFEHLCHENEEKAKS